MATLSIKINDLTSVKAEEMIERLLAGLKDREKDIIIRRHGLNGEEKQILEGIGKIHNLTRERVRQIEAAGLKKIREEKSDAEELDKIENLLKALIQAHGGIMEKEHLFEILSHYGISDAEPVRQAIFRNFYNFFIFKLLASFQEVNNSATFHPHIKLAGQDTDSLETLVASLKEAIAGRGKILTAAELYALAEKVARESGIEIKGGYEDLDLGNFYEKKFSGGEESRLAKENPKLFSLLRAAKLIDHNVFGHWGLSQWPEINPKNLNEKIYLVLKNEGKSLHFSDIAKKIDGLNFDRKKTNIASAHNELILDDKYVLVGRGMYGLVEWGLQVGTVAEIIARIIASKKSRLTREEIIEQVLRERMVKKTTIALALANKERFVREEDGYRLNGEENALVGETSGLAEEKTL